ncbi:hypothetical protein cand_006240 [Cryptosporidium andersoni]|uniref:Uncharacterized protein n=1 Tax=Cryptosporidium andersoni TaxID=117008 RepID=A0A1J4MPN8_9CRYT|nr:hypothetical protein cand_006240 [Cryptosporidium andersoni]
MFLQQNNYVSSLWKPLLCFENYDSLKVTLLILNVIHESNINFAIRAAYPLRYRSDGTQLLIMKKVHYQSTSPDELAISEAARLLGVEFWKHYLDKLEIILTTHQARLVGLGQKLRMSLIIQEMYMKLKSFLNNSLNMTTLPSEYLHSKKLLIKGTDTSIFKITLLDNKSRDLTESIIYKLSSNGLRTLVLGYRYLEEDEYRTYSEEIHNLSDSLTREISTFIEQKINIGIIRIEDKLQGVPELISDMKDADIRLWVLTGDKFETAVNIGYSCNLLDQMTCNLIIDGKSSEAITSQLKFYFMYSRRKKKSNPLEVELKSLNSFMFYSNFPTQSKINNPEVSPRRNFILLQLCTKFNPKVHSLAMDDEANDVGMIISAKVGIGIFDREGIQATKTANFGILNSPISIHYYFMAKQLCGLIFITVPMIALVLYKNLPHYVPEESQLLYKTPPCHIWPFVYFY